MRFEHKTNHWEIFRSLNFYMTVSMATSERNLLADLNVYVAVENNTNPNTFHVYFVFAYVHVSFSYVAVALMTVINMKICA